MAQADIPKNLQSLSLDLANLRQILRIVTFWIAVVWVGEWVIAKNLSFIFLLVLAWLVAIAMEPAISFLAKRGMKRGGATGVVLLSGLFISLLFLGLFGGVLFSQASSLIQSLPDLVTNVVDWLNSSFKLTLDPNKVIDQLNVSPSQMANWASGVAGGVVGFISTLIGGIFQGLTLLLFTFYIAAEGPKLRRLIGSWLSPKFQDVFVTAWDIATAKTGGFVVSKLAMAAISATAHSAFFALIGVPYWLAMGLITGITSQFIPTVGTYLGILIPVVVTVFQNPMNAVWIIIFAGIYQQFENYVISPRISRKTMDIHPAVAFGSVILFANLFGAMGALVAIPIAAAIVAIVDTYGHRYELIDQLAIEANPTTD
jgi:predicted PurR-regulated permease PerM